jgi:serine/threonine protein kinase
VTPERLRAIETLFHEARERTPPERDAFLARACANDPALRREVESLLAQPPAGAIDAPIGALVADLVTPSAPRLAPGSSIGPYRIERLLDVGGMGEVYRARDTRLGRTVAIKVSLKQFSGRFEREARAIAAMNHPHICTLCDVGPNYLVMELVEGETLADALKRGRLTLDQALRYAAQIADALAAAHAQGIVHRDLKPGNVMIAQAGVKVLDFGLAKHAVVASEHAETGALTAADARTEAGQMIGTVAYMSPEQAEGKHIDVRSDVFAFGVVLYEMLSGRRPFQGETKLSTLASILQATPAPLSHHRERIRTFRAGQAFVDSGQGHVHLGRNQTNQVTEVWVTYLDVPPVTGAVRIDAADPGTCQF